MKNFQKKITLKQIGRELGYSTSTVSKALKNSSEISIDTKATIKAFAEFHNYRPNPTALSLRNGGAKNIGVIFPSINESFYTAGFYGIEKTMANKGYNVTVCISDGSLKKEMNKVQMLNNLNIDGFIISLTAETKLKNDLNHINDITKYGTPLVFFERNVSLIKCSNITDNNSEIAYLAVKKLINQGRKRIAMVTTETESKLYRERKKGYVDAVKAHNLDENIIFILSDKHRDEHVINSFLRISKIDAVLCINEDIAMYLSQIIQLRSLMVPNNISLVGYADLTSTNILQVGEQTGRIAANMLIERIENSKNSAAEVCKVLKHYQ